MVEGRVIDLEECGEFRQALQARPPRVAHGAVALLAGLVVAALAWSALTRADLVVRAQGRVRPVGTPQRVYSAARSEVLSASTRGRVVEVRVREGDAVARGDLLVRLEAGRLENEIADQCRALRESQAELVRLARLEVLAARQFEAAQGKAEAELARAREDVAREERVREVEVRLAQVGVEEASDEDQRLRRLGAGRAAAPADLVKARARARREEQKLAQARLPVDAGRVLVARRALELVGRDYAVRREELKLRRAGKEGEVEAARVKLANLELERDRADIRAPLGGVVTRGDVKVGDLLEPGQLVAEIARQGGVLFEGTVPSDEVGHLRVGMPVRVKLDAYDYQRYGTLAGTLCFLSPDSGTGEGKQAGYTVRVALDGDEVGRGEFRGQVKLGMAGRADVVTGQESLLSLLVRRLRQTISLD
jgi:multidrug resistance efflux pump